MYMYFGGYIIGIAQLAYSIYTVVAFHPVVCFIRLERGVLLPHGDGLKPLQQQGARSKQSTSCKEREKEREKQANSS
jgi:hypothetical protein